jgi:DNA helicase-2/ATP-dependent DNA helicase PcrA
VLELELTRRNIPFVKFGGLKFLESAHIKDVLAILRLLENPRDEVSWFRVLQLLDGIGPAAARTIISQLGVRDAPPSLAPSPAALSARPNLPALPAALRVAPASLPGTGDAAASTLIPSPDQRWLSPLQILLTTPPRVTEAARAGLEQLRQTFADCLAAGGTLPPASEIARIRRFCEPIFEQRYSSPHARLADIEQLEQVAGAHSSRGRFLSELALDPPTSTSDLAGPPILDEDYLILSTIHSAKGGEWDVVHVIHAADGMIPSDMATGDKEAIEEERRLFYVALTRARDNLYVYFALRFYRRPRGLDDAHHFAQLTRFLPESVRALFDRRSAGPAPVPVNESPATGPAQSVDALLAGLLEA